MNREKKHLAQLAITESLKIRKKTNYDLKTPVNIYDLCERIGVSVFLNDIPSMEGLYLPTAQPRPVIIVSAQRPSGRKAITCGHELGHHIFKHGRQWDELNEIRTEARKYDPEEYQADMFCFYLLMPKSAVSHALHLRSIDPINSSPEDIFKLSVYFGVSYEAFINHLSLTLNLINSTHAKKLLSAKPKEIRARLLSDTCPQNLIVADFFWNELSIDVEVGDSIIVPPNTILEGHSSEIQRSNESKTIITAVTPGICRASHPSGWCAFIRVMRKDYVGLATLRFVEETGDEN